MDDYTAAAATEATETTYTEPTETYSDDLADIWSNAPSDVTPEAEPVESGDDPYAVEESQETEPASDAPDPTATQPIADTWTQEADTLLEGIGGRENLAIAVDVTRRLFGLASDGPSFLENLRETAPGVYQNLAQEILSQYQPEITPELQAQVLQELGLDATQIENYRLLSVYGFDPDMINSDVRQRAVLDTLTPDDRAIFQNAPADIREQIVDAFDLNRPTVVRRMLDAERADQEQQQSKRQAELQTHQEQEMRLNFAVNEKVDAQVNALNQEYARALKLPLTYVEGVMLKALRGMEGKAVEGQGVALHYASLKKAIQDGNTILQGEAVKQLKPYVDAAFRAQLELEKQQAGDYDFHGFYAKAAPAPAPSPQKTNSIPAQFQAAPQQQASRGNPDDIDLKELLFGRS